MSHEMRTCYAVTMDYIDRYQQLEPDKPYKAGTIRSSLHWLIQQFEDGVKPEAAVWFALGHIQAECAAALA